MHGLDEGLFERARSGDRAAREEVFEANTGLIWACAKRYAGFAEKEDLFQIGAIGLLKAIARFDPSYGAVFSTFAVPHILGEMRRHLRDTAPLKVERRLKEISYLARKARQEIATRTGEEPSLSQIAEVLGVPVDVVCEAVEATAPVLYLEDVQSYQEKSQATADPISMDLAQALDRLEPGLRAVIEGRFFLGKTQFEISRELGISQAQVSRLEKRALLSLRDSLGPKAAGF
jgi:RNA polymerase sporulation-specific sigma factor